MAMALASLFAACVLSQLLVVVRASLLPIFFMHGINDNHNEFNDMQGWIREIDPNVTLYSLPVGDDGASWRNLWDQGEQIMDKIREQSLALPEVYKDGYVLLGHSQGALTARTVVERMDDHNIHTFIGLAGPQMGEYGIPHIKNDAPLLQKLEALGKELVYSVALSGPLQFEFQDKLSFANYWNDPRPRAGLLGKPHDDYLRGNTFLPVLNNNPHRSSQGPGKIRNATEAARYKANFLRLQRAVFTAGTVDDVIIPWSSAVWEFFDQTAENTVPLNQTDLWASDWLGLRELHRSDRLILTKAQGVCHICWAHDRRVFDTYIAPHLTERQTSSPLVVV